MRVAMYYSNNDVRLQNLSKPNIGKGEALMRVEASGICGSDVMEWYRAHKVPLVLGHEIAGQVEAVGEGVLKYKKGDRIAASHHVPCGSCHYCLNGHPTVCETLRKTNFFPGGFSEFVRLPAINVEKGIYCLPEEVSYEEATFIEPLACCLRGQKLAGMKKGLCVLVIGSGISGLLHIQLAKLNGAKTVIATDVVNFRLEQARRFGADIIMRANEDVSSRIRQTNEGRLADLVILCASNKSAIAGALRSVERGGTVLFFSAAEHDTIIEFPFNELFWRSEITLMSSYAATSGEHLEALELIQHKQVDVRSMITHRLKLEDTGLGFQLVSMAQDSIKVIIEPQR